MTNADNYARNAMHRQSFPPGSQRPVTKLLEECLAGDAAAVRATLATDSTNVNLEAVLDNGWTALQVACHHQYVDIARLLVQNGAKLDVTGGVQGMSPLHIAVTDGNAELARMLLENNANPNRLAMWDAPIHVAVQNENSEIVQFLLDAGAVTEQLNGDGMTPLIIAAARGNVAIARQLLDRGAEPDSSKARFNSPLLAACKGGHIDLAALLLDAGASIDKSDADDCTPLFFAVQADNVDLAKLLLRRGASTTIRGVAVLDLPDLVVQNPEMLQALQVQGAIQGPRITAPTAKTKPKKVSALQFIMPPSEDDVHKQSACRGFDITMVNFYASGSVEEWLPVTASVHSVLYSDGPKALLDAAREEAGIRYEPDFTWYHIPANNLTWAEHLITRLKAEKDGLPKAEKRQMKLPRLEQSAREQLNFAHPKQTKAVAAGNAFLKPSCTPTGAVGDDATSKEVMLVLPFLHFETFNSFQSMRHALEAAKTRFDMRAFGFWFAGRGDSDIGEENVDEDAAYNPLGGGGLPSLTSIMGRRGGKQAPRVMSPASLAEYGGANIARAWSTGRAPTIHHSSRNMDAASFRTFPPRGLASHETAGAKAQSLPSEAAKPSAVRGEGEKRQDVSRRHTSTSLQDALILGYMGGTHVDDRGFQPRRTLDQYKYSHLGSIKERDGDQVVYRHTKSRHQEAKLFMVDQLWLWVLEENTLVTCSPLRWDAISKDVKLHFQPRSGPQGPQNALRRLFPFLHPRATEQGPQLRKPKATAPRHAPLHWGSVEFVSKQRHGYKTTFTGHGDEVDRSAHCLKEVHEAVEESTLCSITHEIESLIEIADILDELEILKTVLEDQKDVVNSFNGIKAQLDSASSDMDDSASSLFNVDTAVRESHLARIQGMEESAKKIEQSFYRITDLKQKHASQLEAASAAQQARDTARQGNAIVLFTVVTIVFLPISFMAAFFAINIEELQFTANGKLPLTYVVKYMVAVGLGLSIPFILIAFNLDVVAKAFSAIKRMAKPATASRSLVLVAVQLAVCGIIIIVLWTAHLATNIKTAVTVVIGLGMLLTFIAMGIYSFVNKVRAGWHTSSGSTESTDSAIFK